MSNTHYYEVNAHADAQGAVDDYDLHIRYSDKPEPAAVKARVLEWLHDNYTRGGATASMIEVTDPFGSVVLASWHWTWNGDYID